MVHCAHAPVIPCSFLFAGGLCGNSSTFCGQFAGFLQLFPSCFRDAMGRSRRGTAPNTRPRATARRGTRSARSPPAPASTISNEALVLQLQQRHLVTSGSRTARLARLEEAIREENSTRAQQLSPVPDGPGAPATGLSDEVRAEIQRSIASTLAELLPQQGPSSSEQPPDPTTIAPAAATPTPNVDLTTGTTSNVAQLPTGPVPRRIAERIARGEFVGFDDLLPGVLAATSRSGLED